MVKIIIPKWESLKEAGLITVINGREELRLLDLMRYLSQKYPQQSEFILKQVGRHLPVMMKEYQYNDFRAQYAKNKRHLYSDISPRIILEEEDDDKV